MREFKRKPLSRCFVCNFVCTGLFSSANTHTKLSVASAWPHNRSPIREYRAAVVEAKRSPVADGKKPRHADNRRRISEIKIKRRLICKSTIKTVGCKYRNGVMSNFMHKRKDYVRFCAQGKRSDCYHKGSLKIATLNSGAESDSILTLAIILGDERTLFL